MRHRSLFCFACLLLSIIALSLILSRPLQAQDGTNQTTEGTEFWIAFQKNFRDSIEESGRHGEAIMRPSEPLHQGLTISSTQATNGYVEVPGIGYREEFTLEPNKPIRVWLDLAVQINRNETPLNLGVHVVTTNPVTVVATSHRFQTTDSYLAFPVASLGKRYRAVGYKWLASDLLSQFAVLATEDQTEVTIVPSVETGAKRPAGKPFTITLNRGEAYQVVPEFHAHTPSDLTGTLIESDKPVALFSGHNCAYVPTNMYKACNLLIEQLPPVNSWGKRFIASPFSSRESFVLRIVADRQGTEVAVNGQSVAKLDPGKFYEIDDLNDNTLITSNLPVMVMQYATGYTYKPPGKAVADSIGDPMMILLPPSDRFLTYYNITVPFDGEWDNYVNLVVPSHIREMVRVNGKPVAPSIFKSIPNTSFVAASLELGGGTHTIQAPEAFGVIQYGFGYGSKIYDAYGNIGGMAFPILDEDRVKQTTVIEAKEEEQSVSVPVKSPIKEETGIEH
ncbi:MAG: IgGFc-binding protein [Ignavibacteriae bacterium]|nr:IgGFc-binding protein [Ignavibacteriota bacterium]MCB9216963.1 IgGFc-binding protein [Ignavibacteria bacterium]